MSASHPASRNVRTVAKVEEASLRDRSALERFSDSLTAFAGTRAFLIAQVCLISAWLAVNTGWLPLEPIDPFPFHLLTLCLAVEALLLEIFVLMNQNRMTREAHRRAHLDLQINLLAEQEMTYALQMLRKICEHLSKAGRRTFSDSWRGPTSTSCSMSSTRKACSIRNPRRPRPWTHGGTIVGSSLYSSS